MASLFLCYLLGYIFSLGWLLCTVYEVEEVFDKPLMDFTLYEIKEIFTGIFLVLTICMLYPLIIVYYGYKIYYGKKNGLWML